MILDIKCLFSKKGTKIDEIFTVGLTLCSKCQIDGKDFREFLCRSQKTWTLKKLDFDTFKDLSSFILLTKYNNFLSILLIFDHKSNYFWPNKEEIP